MSLHSLLFLQIFLRRFPFPAWISLHRLAMVRGICREEKQIFSQKHPQSRKSSTLLPQWQQQFDWENYSALSSGWAIIRLNAGEWLPNCFQVCKQEKHRSKEKAPPLKHTQAELCAHMPTDWGEKVRARSGEINIYKGRSTQEDKGTMTAIASTTGW